MKTNMRNWTREEIEFLKEHYPTKGNKFCAESLGKSTKQIKTCTKKLELKSTLRKTKEQTLKELKEYNYHKNGEEHFGVRLCPRCNNKIKHKAQNESYLLRNIKKLELRYAFCLSCSKTGENNPFHGKKHSNEIKNQISTSRIGKACGKDNSMNNPVHRKKVSDVLKAKYASGDLDFQKKINRDTMIKNIKNGKLKCTLISKAETDLKRELENKGLKINQQFSIGTLKYDLLLLDSNILIEYNGDYWHCNPEKYDKDYFNQKKNMYAHELWKRDADKKKLAEDNGYVVITIWEKDYKKNKGKQINRIIKEI
jgi:very-short-patch-repair endonuclease